ncbi:hypothetical protein BCR33DRAFT_720231 [Rhizoclosmatium globosum]|uniref:Dynein heavy chain, cytoplasmic n=1 Tax=Rhizoclosmatium globosum TaxID=329046 RepID=A0A1Y2BXA1_9FUNG|nr:hypothetical protein BCR33DRAFT_720231 [Rhizoclosmatium globosum]|eukprot:ORY39399.1 hypothetical protein BCR33DRAFT_720231 [Rhizoclosmatium globosum]
MPDEKPNSPKKKDGDDAEAVVHVDARANWFEEKVCNALKIKNDKFKKMLTLAENNEILGHFLDKEFNTLLFYLNQKEELIPAVNFPSQLKKKAIYFLKKNLGQPVTEIGELTIGDLSANPLEFLSTLLEEVYLPLLTNPKNLEAWPEVVANDVLRHFHQLNGAVYVISGKSKGKTMLPLPHGARINAESDKSILHTLESAVIDWTHQIKEVIKSNSAAPLEQGLNPGPQVEIDFWAAKAANLKSIHQQLTEDKIQKISKVLQASKSTYYPAFKMIFDEVVFALDEASDINNYLKALRPSVERLTSGGEFIELVQIFPGMLRTLVLIWKNSKSYNTPTRLSVILQEICNDIIDQARNFIQPAELFTAEPEEAAERLRLVLRVSSAFKQTVYESKASLAESPHPWNFDAKHVFGRLETFESRVQQILNLFDSIIEFNRLEKIEIGGTKGKILSSQVMQIFTEFQAALGAFSKLKYDILDISLPNFDEDLGNFHTAIMDLDRRIGTILCQSFDDCSGVHSCFRLLESFSGLLNRPVIQQDFEKKYFSLLKTYSQDLDDANLKDRIGKSMEKLKTLNHSIMNSDEAGLVKNKYNELLAGLDAYEKGVYDKWAETIIDESEQNLNKPLIVRKEGLLDVNFDPKVVALLREVKYFGSLNVTVPETAAGIYAKSEVFRKFIYSLEHITGMYNGIRTGVLDVERPLIQSKIDAIDEQMEQALTTLNWNASTVEEYIGSISATVGNLNSILQQTKNNVTQMQKTMKVWANAPFLERKDGKKLLAMEEKEAKLNAVYEMVKRDGASIHNLVKQTSEILGADTTSEIWSNYLVYVDNIVREGFFNAIKTSLDYLTENMDRDRMAGKEIGPLLEAKLELDNDTLVFTPGMSDDSGDGLNAIVSDLLNGIYEISSLMTRISPSKVAPIKKKKRRTIVTEEGEEEPQGVDHEEEERERRREELESQTYLGEMNHDENLDNLREEIMSRVAVIMEECTAYRDGFEQYAYLWTENRQEYMARFLAAGKTEEEKLHENDEDQPIQLEKFENEIRKFEGIHKTIMALDPEVIVESWFRIDAKPLKQSLNVVVKKWSYTLTKHLSDQSVTTLNDLNKFVKNTKKGLLAKIEEGDYNGLVTAMGLLHAVKHRMANIDAMFEPLRKTINLLRNFGVEMPDEIHKLLADLPEEWSDVTKRSVAIKDLVAPLQAKEVDVLQQKCNRFESKNHQFREDFRKKAPFRFEIGPERAYDLIDSSHMDVSAMEGEAQGIKTSCELFELNVPNYKQLIDCRRDIGMLKWRTTLWTEIDTDSMENRCRDLGKELRRMDKEIKGWDVYSGLDQMLRSPAIRDRHWKQLMKTTGVTFVLTKDMKFEDLLSLQLHKYEDDVKNIMHEATHTALLRSSEELIETLEDNQVMLQNMMSSNQISKWQNTLSTVDSVCTLWLEVQQTWSHLENIFMGSEDIRAQLPEDSKRFDGIDSKYKELMQEACKTPNAVEACTKEGLYDTLEKLQGQLALCEKSLAEYLETKRLAFPRFYFVSGSDLLDILAKGNIPIEVAVHLAKLFDSIARLEFQKNEKGEFTKTAVGMYSQQDEYVEFVEKCECTGAVEVWLNRLVDTMRKTLKHLLGEGVSTYEEKPREQWIFDFPAQITLAGSQIWWTTEVNAAFARLEEGYENSMKDYYKKQVNQLTALISLIQGELSKNDRQMIMTVCTLDVHARDQVAKLIQEKAENAQCFSWQSQLRLRWDDMEGDCFINICDAIFRYTYEYLGNTPRLVITALTDRCYITLTQALHLILGGAPAGPAGTGKTETVKDLGKALAIMVYVFNCSEQMDYKSVGNIFKGLAQSGTWGCFDEFNRISVEVLSVIATQVKSIQDALRFKKKRFIFQGEDISLCRTVGRTELPENIKALFRPCSMCVPNLELICEIMLMAEGFIEASSLARKFNTLYKLNRELLSKQDHYDWGLRAIKSVLVVAGSLKRSDPIALRDFNLPKIVTDDLQVFMGLIGDLFPKIEVLRKRNEKLEEEIRKATIENGLQAEEIFVLKCVQLEELLAVRHCVFIIGNGAVSTDDLFGCINPSTREWKDGLFSCILRDQASMPGSEPKWMILDGDIDPNWIESLNTVMDDNKMLTLASNERIPLKPYMRLIFEIGDLKYATPATVSRAGILYLNTTDLGWNPYVQSWLDKREDQSEKSSLSFPCCALCNILEGLLTPQNTPKGCDKEWFEIYFVFAAVGHSEAVLLEFSKWWNGEFKAIKFPPGGTVFDYYVEQETKRFLPWTDRVPVYEYDPEMPLSSVLVHTAETTRVRYLLDVLVDNGKPVLLIGNAGCGKTVLMQDKLYSYGEDRLIVNVPFNFYTTAWSLQTILEKPLEKKAGRNYGPPGAKKLIYFLDDLNMPEVDKYGTASPHTLLRQYLDYRHWYDRAKLTLKEIHNCQYVACMNPTAGSFTISGRLGRHFATFSVNFPSAESLQSIYLQILSAHLKIFPNNIQKLGEKLVLATLALHKKVASSFLPSAVKFHYIFNRLNTLKEPMDLIRIWLHETTRTYADKMVEFSDATQFQKFTRNTVNAEPIMFTHFAGGIGEPKYGQIRDWATIKRLLDEAQMQYEETNAAMNLVLFEDAMSHICRINRILESSGKQSLSRLAAFISSMDKRYSINDLKKLQIMFLLTDSQVADEKFLVLINDMLASGNIPGLFPDEEVDNIINAMRNEVKAQGLQDTREICWDWFIRTVRKNLKVVLCFSPVGNTLRSRCRKFPAIVNCTIIDWFHEWPEEALNSVATRFISTSELVPDYLKAPVTKFMAFCHQSVNAVSRRFLVNEKRHNYTTPKSFLALIAIYKDMLEKKSTELTRAMDPSIYSAQVDDLKAKLAFQEVDLKAKNEDALRLIERKVDAFTKEVTEKAAACEHDLKAAEPALAAAANALNTLNKANLTELKSLDHHLKKLLILWLRKIAKDRSWKAGKNMMAKVDAFLDSLITFNKEAIDQSNLDALQPYLSDPNFNEEFMKSKSLAAAGLCSWVVNIPKRKSLEAANNELQVSQNPTADKLKCEEEAKSTQDTIVLANRLVNGLASEKVRWSEAVGRFKEQEKTLAGDVLLSAAFVSYVGCFSKRYREDLLQDNWLKYLKAEDNKDRVPLSPDVDPLAILTNSAEVAKWNNEGLPTDRVSLENATMVTSCKRWPLIIDPQLQGASLKIVRLGARGYLDLIEKAVSSGDPILIEDIAESIDPVLNPLLGRETIKKGKYVKMGDKEVEYDPRFKMILQTRLANPHYPPEIQAQTTLINFTVTLAGLEDQLLADVVNIERADLERTKADLTKQQNEFKIKLTELEDALLSRLSAAQGNFLGDTALVENLETTKRTATEIEQKVEDAKRTEKKINETRELYRPVAARSSLLYFLLNDLWQIHPMYQYSLNAYKVVFQNAINRADASEDIKERVNLLIDSITHMVFIYTTRGLFERDKLIFLAQMTFQILGAQDDMDPVEKDFLLKGPRVPNINSPFEWLGAPNWQMIKALSNLEQFRTLSSDIEGSSKQWKKYCENECPESEKLPQEWKNKCLRPDRMSYAVRNFIGMKMGAKYMDSSRIPLAKSYEEMKPATPIFFILSPGALGRTMGISEDNKNFHNVSLGQGQEVIAEQKLDIAYRDGGWVMLENIHLVAKWLPILEKKLEALSIGLSYIPISILQASIKITNEPPTGMQANIHRALDNFNQESLERCSKDAEFKAILFALCYFHAVVLERRKFGTQGWNKGYPFSTGDLMICTDVLFNYLEQFSKVPWTDLKYIFGEIMYGGHISDDWDRRLCSSYLDVYLREEMLDGGFELAPGFASPPTSDYKEYHRYIEENLPPESPYLDWVLTKMADKLFQTILEMQPQDAAGGSAMSKDEKVRSFIEEIISTLPDNFNRTPYISVAIQECDRMSILTSEIRRSLKELELGLRGDLTITENMETLMNAMFMNQIPASWEKLAFPSLSGLALWYADLLLRIKELENWVAEFQLPAVVWMSGLFNPQSFLTAIMQTTARKNEWPLDRMVLTVDVTKKAREEFSGAPREGAYVHGLFMEGARWDTGTGLIQESHLKDLTPAMPVIYIKAIPVDKRDMKGVYECPVYRTRQRGPTFVWTFNLKTKERPQKWVLGGVALLASID